MMMMMTNCTLLCYLKLSAEHQRTPRKKSDRLSRQVAYVPSDKKKQGEKRKLFGSRRQLRRFDRLSDYSEDAPAVLLRRAVSPINLSSEKGRLFSIKIFQWRQWVKK
mmetsp:Transcript_32092/g.73848  ORF Transcript_32092/g.73848 Transcript_32092/m.73848 type:complete len:107 (+) Transcript_32092:145-465(+)